MKTNSTKTTTRLACIAGFALTASMANAAIIAVDTTYGFTTSGLAQLTNLSGTNNGSYDAADPTTWNEIGSGFGDMSYANPLVSATNSKLGWYAFDLGSSQGLDKIYAMNGYYLNNDERLSMDQFNVYYSTTPTVALASGGDYNFSSGGWTQLGGLNTFVNDQSTAFEVDATGVTARFIGIEMTRELNATDGRIGMNEFAVTAVPEPSAALLGGLGLLALLRRRRS